MVEVAVIGAGASGLVASRNLLGNGLRPLIFETSKAIGGERLPKVDNLFTVFAICLLGEHPPLILHGIFHFDLL